MSEVEKMYENAGVKPEINYVCDKEPCEQHSVDCQKCSHLYDTREDYPDFTAEKQIAIIKLISKQGQVIIENWEKDNRGFNVTFRANSNLRYITMDCITRKTVEEALAQIVNDIWQDLTEEEKQQVKEILNG